MYLKNLFSFERFQSLIALALSALITVESVQAAPGGVAPAVSSIALPITLGQISASYFPQPSAGRMPDVILIQDLHVNRSVQFAISGILRCLESQGLLRGPIAVEGATGPVNIASMQAFPDAKIRKAASDYLVQQGEMPGAMHYAVSEGRGSLYGVETEEVYKANLDVYQRSYQQRLRLKEELGRLSAVLARLRHDPVLKEKAGRLASDVESMTNLVNTQTISDEIPKTLNHVLGSVDRVKALLPKEVADSLTETLSAGTNFYTLALMRDEDLYQNMLSLRAREHQATTVLVAGGFHTQGLEDQCKKQSLSYVVITPNVKKLDAIDEKLYIERLLGHHLTPEQVAQGLDWASMDALQPLFRTTQLFGSAVTAVSRSPRRMIATALIATLAPWISMMHGQQTQNVPQVPATPIISLSNAVKLIDEQRGHDPEKLPLTFREPANVRMPRDPADPTGVATEQVVREGVGLYDTALAIWAYTSNEDFKKAKELIEIYRAGTYGENMELTAYPKPENTTPETPNAFQPFDENSFYYFNFTRYSGVFESNWTQWNAHTGPNAWLAMSVAHYILLSGDRDPKLIQMVRSIGDAMIRLQDPAALGSVRYGPHQWHRAGEPDPYDRINFENEVSAYAALHYIFAVTGETKYQEAANKIVHWLKDADIYNPRTEQMQKGMMNSKTKTFYVDAKWDATHKRWEIIPESATDSMGTWTISSLSPKLIDSLWGKRTAFQMYLSIREQMGVTADFKAAGLDKPVAGVDFSDKFPNQRLISREWSKGDQNAAERILEYYREGEGKGQLSAEELRYIQRDIQTIGTFISQPQHSTQYAEGPGMNSPRNGQTGWFWFSGRGDAMAAVFGVLPSDPLDTTKLKIVTSAPSSVKNTVSTPAPTQASRSSAVREETEAPVFSLVLTEQYGGEDYWGNWKSVTPAQSEQTLSSKSLEYNIIPNDPAAFKGFHVDVKGNANLTLYGLWASKQGDRWILEAENGKHSQATARVDGDRIIVTIPITEIQASMQRAHASRIVNVQIETGIQQDGRPLNDKIIHTRTTVRALGNRSGALFRKLGSLAMDFVTDYGIAVVKGVASMAFAIAVVLGSQEQGMSATLNTPLVQTVANTSLQLQSNSMPMLTTALMLAASVSAVAALLLVRQARQKTAVGQDDPATPEVEKVVEGIPDSRQINGWRRRIGYLPTIAIMTALLTVFSCSKSATNNKVETPIVSVENLGQPTARLTLYGHYEGGDGSDAYKGYWTQVSPALSARILNSKYVRYTFNPSDAEAFKGFHIEIQDSQKSPFYGAYGQKSGGKWTIRGENNQPINATINEVNGTVVVVIPISELKIAMKNGNADRIFQFHGQTGAQQNQIPLNDQTIPTGVTVEAFGSNESGSLMMVLPGDDRAVIIPVQATQESQPKIYDQTLYEHYEGEDYQGYFTRVSPAQSSRILASKKLEYIFAPSDFDNFKGFHVDIKSPDELMFFDFYGMKKNGRWVFVDAAERLIKYKISVREEEGSVIVSIDTSDVKAAMTKAGAERIGQLHGQTGQQQNDVKLNDRNIPSGVEVKAYGTAGNAWIYFRDQVATFYTGGRSVLQEVSTRTSRSIQLIRTQAKTEEPTIYNKTLFEHYEGFSWQGYFTRVTPEESRQILNGKTLEYAFYPKDYENFKGLQVDIKGIGYRLVALKNNGKWQVVDHDTRQPITNSSVTIHEADGGVIVQIPTRELKEASARSGDRPITQLHGQTGKQQEGRKLNDQNIEAGVEVRVFGSPSGSIHLRRDSQLAEQEVAISETQTAGITGYNIQFIPAVATRNDEPVLVSVAQKSQEGDTKSRFDGAPSATLEDRIGYWINELESAVYIQFRQQTDQYADRSEFALKRNQDREQMAEDKLRELTESAHGKAILRNLLKDSTYATSSRPFLQGLLDEKSRQRRLVVTQRIDVPNIADAFGFIHNHRMSDSGFLKALETIEAELSTFSAPETGARDRRLVLAPFGKDKVIVDHLVEAMSSKDETTVGRAARILNEMPIAGRPGVKQKAARRVARTPKLRVTLTIHNPTVSRGFEALKVKNINDPAFLIAIQSIVDALSIEHSEETQIILKPYAVDPTMNAKLLQALRGPERIAQAAAGLVKLMPFGPNSKIEMRANAVLFSTTAIADLLIHWTHGFLYFDVPQSQSDSPRDLQIRAEGMQQAADKIRELLARPNGPAALEKVLNDNAIPTDVKKVLSQFRVPANSKGNRSQIGKYIAAVAGFFIGGNILVELFSRANAATLVGGTVRLAAESGLGVQAMAHPSVASVGASAYSPHLLAYLIAAIAVTWFIGRLTRHAQSVAAVAQVRSLLPQLPETSTVVQYARSVLNYAPDWMRERFMRNPMLAARYRHKANEMGILTMMVAA